ncbi:MAG: flagellar hook-associated protein FlgK [Acidobacteriia bacterium]|nr:flagellar hook-associated protein FlgK [Terriglobia bacterium]
MSNLLSSLITSAGALQAYSQVLDVTQNNVTNASTPGYARQSQEIVAMPFDPATGATGGITTSQMVSSRNEYAEQAVRQQSALLGDAQQNVSSFTALQPLFDISGNAGIPSALNSLFQSFSAWGQTPGDSTARRTVMARATDLANAFNQTAAGLDNVSQDTEKQLQQTVTQVNQLLGQLQGYNRQILQGERNDAGLDARVHAALEQLSQYIDVTAMPQPDGSMSVLLNGQTPLVIGDKEFTLAYHAHQPDNPPAVFAGAPPHAQIVAADGTDITAKVTGGQLGTLLNLRNKVLPSYIGDAYQAGDLNTMAKQFAERVNGLLTSGQLADGTPGAALFTFDAVNDTQAARTLAVDPAVQPDQLAAIDPGPPAYVSNGIPLALSRLASPVDDADRINGASYNEFYGGIAASVGGKLADANNQLAVQQSALAQAKNMRQQMSGVSLDEEAAILIQFQRAYEANSKLITILDQLTQDTINILQT